jgi:hypothetical protein
MSAKKSGPSIIEEVTEGGEGGGIHIEDFVAYLPAGVYVFTPCRETWVGKTVNSRLPRMPALDKHGRPKKKRDRYGDLQPVTVTPTHWLDNNRGVTQMAWAPGQPMMIKDRMVVDGGWIERKDVTIFNLYRPPRIKLGDAAKATKWVDHVNKLFAPADANHIIKYFAMKVQRPEVKINHALVLGGAPGAGKDSLVEPVKYAIGPWNFHEVSPTNLLGEFNNFAKSVILRINEARDLGDMTRFSFYDKTKIMCAAPPDVLRVNEKHIKEYYVFNVMGCIITTNYKSDGIFLPADDRRHFVAWTRLTEKDFSADYWDELWSWYNNGGFEHVAAYLNELTLSDFDPKAPPPKTQAFWDIVLANTPPEDAGLADLLEALGNPDVVTRNQMIVAAKGEIAEWLMDRRNRRAIPHRMERSDYTPVRNAFAKDGLWKVHGTRQVIYAKAELTEEQRSVAIAQFIKDGATRGAGGQ